MSSLPKVNKRKASDIDNPRRSKRPHIDQSVSSESQKNPISQRLRTLPTNRFNTSGSSGQSKTRNGTNGNNSGLSLAWDPTCEIQFVSLQEDFEWLINDHTRPFTQCDLDQVEIDNQSFVLSQHTQFVDSAVLNGLIESKNDLENVPKADVQRARLSCNPFESISKCSFQNRAALKMANLDAISDFLFTGGSHVPCSNSSSNTRPKISTSADELLHFVDICSGPGGFSEYILWRRKWEAKGIGFTLRNENDFKMDLFNSGVCANTFEAFYGALDDGNVYHPQNLLSLRDLVFSRTENKGANLVLGDGGFSVAGQELEQEHLLKRLYLCQFICALGLLREGGNFVCKLFDIFSPVSVSLLYLLYRCFGQFAIVKPNTSRPANSERFVICKHLRPDVSAVKDFLFAVNCRLDQLNEQHLQQLIPLTLLQKDKRFCDYIRSVNTKLGRRQIHFLRKMKAFALDSTLYESKKGELRRRCLELWQVPNRPEPVLTVDLALSRLFKKDHAVLYYPAKALTVEQLKQIKFPWNYRFTTLGEDRDGKCQRGFFLVDKTQQLQHFNDGQWKPLLNYTVNLAPMSIFYAELNSELKGEANGQKKTSALHVLDALFLGEVQVWHRPLDERLAMIEKLFRVWTGPNGGGHNFPVARSSNVLPVRLKKYFNLAEVEQFYSTLEMRECKGKRKERLCVQMETELFSIVCGLHICSTLRPPWACRFSQSGGKLYYFNYKKKMDSIYKCPPEARSDFVDDFSTRLEWTWQDPSELLCSPEEEEGAQEESTLVSDQSASGPDSKVSRAFLSRHIDRILNTR